MKINFNSKKFEIEWTPGLIFTLDDFYSHSSSFFFFNTRKQEASFIFVLLTLLYSLSIFFISPATLLHIYTSSSPLDTQQGSLETFVITRATRCNTSRRSLASDGGHAFPLRTSHKYNLRASTYEKFVAA